MESNIRVIIEIALEGMKGRECGEAQEALEVAIKILEQLDHPDLDEAIDLLTEISVHDHAITMRNI